MNCNANRDFNRKIAKSVSTSCKTARYRHDLVNVATDRDRYEVLRPYVPVCGVKGDPSGTGYIYLHPGMGRSGTCGPEETLFRIGQIAGYDAGPKSKTASCL